MADFNTIPEMQDITRQREMAKLLLTQGMQTPQGQMIGNRYVGAHPLQFLGNLAQTYVGKSMIEESDKKQAELADMLRKQTLQDLQAYGEATTPVAGVEAKPEVIPQGQTALDDQGVPTLGYQAPVAAIPEKKADFNKGLGILMGSKSPQSQELAKLLLADQLKSHVLPEGGTLVRGSLGGNAPVVTAGPKETTDYKNYLSAVQGGYKGSFNDWFMQKENAKGTHVNVNTEQTYGGALAKGAAEQDLSLKSIADSASQTVSNVARQKQILNSGKVFTGKGANIQQELAQYADAVGLGGKDTATKIANTQSAISGLAGVTLDSIKNSGLGSGQGFTDKDREFLQDAKSGRITWNKESIMRVYDLQEKAAIEGAKKWNQRVKQLPKSATGPIGWGEVQVPTPFGQSSVRSEADRILGGQ